MRRLGTHSVMGEQETGRMDTTSGQSDLILLCRHHDHGSVLHKGCCTPARFPTSACLTSLVHVIAHLLPRLTLPCLAGVAHLHRLISICLSALPFLSLITC